MTEAPNLLATPRRDAPPMLRGGIAMAQLAAEKAGIVPEHVAQWQLRETDSSDFADLGYTVEFVLRPAPDWDVKRVELTHREVREAAGLET